MCVCVCVCVIVELIVIIWILIWNFYWVMLVPYNSQLTSPLTRKAYVQNICVKFVFLLSFAPIYVQI